MKRLQDGERRKIGQGWSKRKVKVVAYREDCDTPFVELNTHLGIVSLTDTGAHELIADLKAALNVLPSSK